MKNGFHTVCGNRVYIENDRVLYGMVETSEGLKKCYPYIKDNNGFSNCTGIRVNSFRYYSTKGAAVLI